MGYSFQTSNREIHGVIMESVNYTNARAQLSRLMDQATLGQPVQITRKDREPVVIISKASYEAYKRAEFDRLFPKEMQLYPSDI